MSSVLAVLALIGERIANLAAFFLPLKVILLLGSEGVPRYFRGFIAAESRDEWVVILALGAVSFYALSIALRALEQRLSAKGSAAVVSSATKLNVVREQESVAQDYYGNVVQVSAHILFAVVMLALYGTVLPALLVFVITLLLIEYLSVSLVLGNMHKSLGNRQSTWLRSNIGRFMTALTAINFLAVFGFLLTLYGIGQGPNVLIAFLSVLIARQLFGSISSAVCEWARLWTAKHRIDALVFPEAPLLTSESRSSREFRAAFDRRVHRQRLADLIGVTRDRITSCWSDGSRKGMVRFDHYVDMGSYEDLFVDVVYFPSHCHHERNESLLLQSITPEQLSMPRIVDRYFVDKFVGVVYSLGQFRPQGRGQWKKNKRQALTELWKVRAPHELVRDFASARPLMHQRLSINLLERLDIALDDARIDKEIKHLIDIWPEIRARLSRLPRFLHNAGFRKHSVLVDDGGQFRIVGWGDWRIEPIGVGMEGRGAEHAWLRNNWESIADSLRLQRMCSPSDLILADLGKRFEQLVEAFQLSRAAEVAVRMLKEHQSSSAENR